MDFMQLVSGHSRVYAWVSISQVVLLLGFGGLPSTEGAEPWGPLQEVPLSPKLEASCPQWGPEEVWACTLLNLRKYWSHVVMYTPSGMPRPLPGGVCFILVTLLSLMYYFLVRYRY